MASASRPSTPPSAGGSAGGSPSPPPAKAGVALQPRKVVRKKGTSSASALVGVGALLGTVSLSSRKRNPTAGGGGGSGGGSSAARSRREPVKPGQTRYWGEDEHARFLEGIRLHGEKNYVAVSEVVRTRTAKQVRTHLQKYLMRLARLAKQRAEGGGTAPSTLAMVGAAAAAAAAAGAAA